MADAQDEKPKIEVTPPAAESASKPGLPSVYPSKLAMGSVISEENTGDLSLFGKIQLFFYDKKEGTILGRNGQSWLCITAFYLIYFFFMLSFFFMTLALLVMALSGNRPTITANSGFKEGGPTIIKYATGLNVIGAKELDGRRGIEYNKKDSSSYAEIVDKLANLNGSVSPQFIPIPLNCSSANKFGYPDGEPCVAIRFNKIYNWLPSSLKSFESSIEGGSFNEEKYNEYKAANKKHGNKIDSLKKDKIAGIHCYKKSSDKNKGKWDILLDVGMNIGSFKKTADMTGTWNWPIMFVKIVSKGKGEIYATVECNTFDPNLDLNYAKQGGGAVTFVVHITG